MNKKRDCLHVHWIVTAIKLGKRCTANDDENEYLGIFDWQGWASSPYIDLLLDHREFFGMCKTVTTGTAWLESSGP